MPGACRTVALVVGLVFGLAAIAVGIGMFVFITNFIDTTIKKGARLPTRADDQETYDIWVGDKAPKAPVYRVYGFFNVTNPDAIRKGAVPEVVEMGPYWYIYKSKKVNVVFSEDKSEVSYDEYGWLEFDPSKGGPDPKVDKITSINSVYLSAVNQAGSEEALAVYVGTVVMKAAAGGPWISAPPGAPPASMLPGYATAKPALDNLLSSGTIMGIFSNNVLAATTLGTTNATIIATYFQYLQYTFVSIGAPMLTSMTSPFSVKTPHQYLFNNYDSALGRDGAFFPSYINESRSYDVNAKSRLYTTILKTGYDSPDNVEVVKQLNGFKKFPFWNPPVDLETEIGRAGLHFPPKQTDKRDLYVTPDALYRCTRMTTAKEVTVNGVTANHYIFPDSEFAPQARYYQEIFGVVNFTTYMKYWGYTLEIVRTLPHMYRVDPEFVKVKGLTPDPELHEAHLDIEPTTGYTINGHKRLQTNFLFDGRKYKLTFSNSSSTRNIVFPIVWMDETATISQEDADKMSKALKGAKMLPPLILGVLVGVGGLCILICVAVFFFTKPKAIKTIPEKNETKIRVEDSDG